jgi:hypothetical protein
MTDGNAERGKAETLKAKPDGRWKMGGGKAEPEAERP